MFNYIKNWLSTPYYFNSSIKFKFKISLVLGVLVFLFLYVFKPFTLFSLQEILLNYTLLIGLVTFLGSFFFLTVPPLIFKSYFSEDNWTIGRNILFILIGIFVTGSLLWYIAKFYKDERGIENISYFSYILYSNLVGVIPVLFTIFINEKTLREKRIKRAKEITDFKQKAEKNNEELSDKFVILSDNKRESLEIKISDLVYITSQGNYASFFIKKEENKTKEKILRVTLTEIIKALKDYPHIIRCHKSYIINTKYVTSLTGNARGYLLKSEYIDFSIPVSRSFSKQSLLAIIK
ncbi:MAG: LytTR family DNA-binding domain-containing protein [Polaribacter sp.]|uniref:LytTR family transcriptional regulator DNA-binding domain-containing protein n=1 Tax=Polaribacter sp. TaxID=1920175 RepID=UPI003BB03A33